MKTLSIPDELMTTLSISQRNEILLNNTEARTKKGVVVELDVSTLNIIFSSIQSSTLREIARTTGKLCACIYLVWGRERCDEGGVRGGRAKKGRECKEE